MDIGPVEEHLGVNYKLLKDEDGWYYKTSLEAYIDKAIEAIEHHLGEPLKNYPTPGTPGKHLTKSTGEPQDESGYRKFVGNIIYAALRDLPESMNATRDQTSHLFNLTHRFYISFKVY